MRNCEQKVEKKNQMKVLEVKYTITKIKIRWMSSTEEWREQRKESVNLKVNNRNQPI